MFPTLENVMLFFPTLRDYPYTISLSAYGKQATNDFAYVYVIL